MATLKIPKLSFWRVSVLTILLAGIYTTWVRFAEGLAASTNLSDPVPWGLWVGLNTLCGVGLSAGGFAVAAAACMLGFERYRPILRSAILISFLGYLSVVVGMLFELGLPWRIWHPIVFWNRRSVLFEVAWCVMLYTTVLSLEFSAPLVERLRWPRLRDWYTNWHRRLLVALVLVGVVLSSLHQSFLGGLYLITKDKLYPLWYSPQLPALFFLSSIPAGLALMSMALYLSVRSLRARIDYTILEEVSRVMLLLIGFYGLFRGVDLWIRGGAPYLWKPRPETGLFWLEIAFFVLLPLVLLGSTRVRSNPLKFYWTCAVVVMGFMANRLNVAITALQASSGTNYVPKWTEFVISLAVITAAVVAFRFAVLHLDIFPWTAPAVVEGFERLPVAAWNPPAHPAGVLRQSSRPC